MALVNIRSGDTHSWKITTTTRRATRRPQGTLTVLAVSEEPCIRTEVFHFSTGAGSPFLGCPPGFDPRGGRPLRCATRSGDGLQPAHPRRPSCSTSPETGFLNDFRRFIDALVPVEGTTSMTTTPCARRTSRRMSSATVTPTSALLVGNASVTIPVVDGESHRNLAEGALCRIPTRSESAESWCTRKGSVARATRGPRLRRWEQWASRSPAATSAMGNNAANRVHSPACHEDEHGRRSVACASHPQLAITGPR